MTTPEPTLCGVVCGWRPETTCTDPAGHNGPHAGPLVIGAKEVGVAAWGPDQPEPAQPRHTANSITDDALTALYEQLDAAQQTELARQLATCDKAFASATLRAARAITRAERAEAALDAVRKLHRPVEGQGWDSDEPGERYGHVAQACISCGTSDEYAVRWPCATVRALDAHTTPTETT
ncbi:hypothetical protein [Streptomyces cinereoruber]|uniref:hypothetical protein n=1 Tax=Streptomyces cinereoruber TaxID=67260 RepID=UPI003C2ED8D9